MFNDKLAFQEKETNENYEFGYDNNFQLTYK